MIERKVEVMTSIQKFTNIRQKNSDIHRKSQDQKKDLLLTMNLRQETEITEVTAEIINIKAPLALQEDIQDQAVQVLDDFHL